MQKWAKIENGAAIELNPSRSFILNGEVLSGGILLAYDAFELIGIGLRPINEPPLSLDCEILTTLSTNEEGEVFRDFRIKDNIADIKVELVKDINLKRNLDIEKPIVFRGYNIQTTEKDRENITTAAQSAIIAKMNGAESRDFYWHGGEDPFAWITTDNSLLQLDCDDMLELFNTMVNYRSDIILKSRQLKDTVLSCTTLEELNDIKMTINTQ